MRAAHRLLLLFSLSLSAFPALPRCQSGHNGVSAPSARLRRLSRRPSSVRVRPSVRPSDAASFSLAQGKSTHSASYFIRGYMLGYGALIDPAAEPFVAEPFVCCLITTFGVSIDVPALAGTPPTSSRRRVGLPAHCGQPFPAQLPKLPPLCPASPLLRSFFCSSSSTQAKVAGMAYGAIANPTMLNLSSNSGHLSRICLHAPARRHLVLSWTCFCPKTKRFPCLRVNTQTKCSSFGFPCSLVGLSRGFLLSPSCERLKLELNSLLELHRASDAHTEGLEAKEGREGRMVCGVSCATARKTRREQSRAEQSRAEQSSSL